MTLLELEKSSDSLVYMGYPGETSTTFQITRRRKHDRKRQRSQRGVIQCFVFGPRRSGKSAILDALIGRCAFSFIVSLVLSLRPLKVQCDRCYYHLVLVVITYEV